MSQDYTDGVFLTNAEVQQSNELKKHRGRSISQLPVFRNAVELLNFTVDVIATSPRNLRKFTDSSIDVVNEIMRCIGLAQENRDGVRVEYIREAMSLVYVLRAHFGVYYSRHILSKDTHNKLRRMCDNTVAQLTGWQDSTIRQGLNLQ